jgi:NosR/NirI family transcriptional regulator, nitrous oxide reductase regulator
MKKFYLNKILRTIVQILFFVFMPGLVGMAFLELKALIVDIFNFNFTTILSDTSLIIVLFLGTIILGRFFCGWMCMFGTYNDLVNLIGKKIFKINYQPNKMADKYFKYLKYFILLFIIIFVWTNIVVIPDGVSPWDALSQLSNPSYAFSNYLIGLIILGFITVGDLFIERFFCRYLCPLGAIFSIISKGRILNIQKPKVNCGLCHACTNKCSMGIDLDATDVARSGECINCLNCTKICPKNNAKLAINNKKINEYAITTLAVAGTTGAYLGVNKIVTTYFPSTNASASVSSKYADGTYIGTGTGYRPYTKVSVTISNGKITSIVVNSTNDTTEFFNKAWTTIKNAIISKQSTSVSTVSGATRSSNGIIAAVNDALNQAEAAKTNASTTASDSTSSSSSIDDSTNTNANSTNTTSSSTNTNSSSTSTTTNSSTSSGTTSVTYKDGTYTGTGTGYRPYTKVSVVISNNKITSITLISTNDTDNFFTKAWSTIKNAIISKQSTSVSTVSGATRSSNGIIAAVNDALTQAKSS